LLWAVQIYADPRAEITTDGPSDGLRKAAAKQRPPTLNKLVELSLRQRPADHNSTLRQPFVRGGIALMLSDTCYLRAFDPPAFWSYLTGLWERVDVPWRPRGVVVRGAAVLAALMLPVGCSAAGSAANTATPHVSATASTEPPTSPSPRPTKVVTTTVMTYGELNDRNPGLTGEANVRPGLLVKVVRTVLNPPVAGSCTGGYGPAGVNENGRIKMFITVTNDKTGAAMDSEISCVHHRRRAR
jgi:hypothetical protein